MISAKRERAEREGVNRKQEECQKLEFAFVVPFWRCFVVGARDARYTEKSVLYRMFYPDTDKFSTIQNFLKLSSQLGFFKNKLRSILKAF